MAPMITLITTVASKTPMTSVTNGERSLTSVLALAVISLTKVSGKFIIIFLVNNNIDIVVIHSSCMNYNIHTLDISTSWETFESFS